MKSIFTTTLFFFICLSLNAQQWVDTTFSIASFLDIEYGTVTDFAGNERSLKMDISVPIGDTIPVCGRPLMVVIHGGAFIAGSKEAGFLGRFRADFAKRGYVTASINYRLGMFHTSSNVHCNVPVWDCYNVADTSEWFRAMYRGVQDAKGAIRYLINRADEYHIDPENVFLAGESAGAVITLATAFLDTPEEVPQDIHELPSVSPPHNVYEGQCIQGFNLDTSINSMQFNRADLGSLDGPLNPSETEFRIRGVGSFYGAMFGNLFEFNADTIFPAVYLFHQPNDLIVPFNYGRLLAGYAYCTVTSAGCVYIVNRPFVYGSKGIAGLIDTLVANGQPAPEYLFEQTNNNANCLLQATNQSLAGHALDNYWLRSRNLAAFFADKVDTSNPCLINQQENIKPVKGPKVYPNPATQVVTIEMPESESLQYVQLMDLTGKEVFTQIIDNGELLNSINLSDHLAPGMYVLVMKTERYRYVEKLLVNR
ncbi:MAG: hypothetical protein DHS20C18_27720 [Saprospiraceae bacterium]|nr:MAG: hypothetical protein DHS20C18_27720 [Saprospiraceae bacterium]